MVVKGVDLHTKPAHGIATCFSLLNDFPCQIIGARILSHIDCSNDPGSEKSMIYSGT
jgi:hypothetical protein